MVSEKVSHENVDNYEWLLIILEIISNYHIKLILYKWSHDLNIYKLPLKSSIKQSLNRSSHCRNMFSHKHKHDKYYIKKVNIYIYPTGKILTQIYNKWAPVMLTTAYYLDCHRNGSLPIGLGWWRNGWWRWVIQRVFRLSSSVRW